MNRAKLALSSVLGVASYAVYGRRHFTAIAESASLVASADDVAAQAQQLYGSNPKVLY